MSIPSSLKNSMRNYSNNINSEFLELKKKLVLEPIKEKNYKSPIDTHENNSDNYSLRMNFDNLNEYSNTTLSGKSNDRYKYLNDDLKRKYFDQEVTNENRISNDNNVINTIQRKVVKDEKNQLYFPKEKAIENYKFIPIKSTYLRHRYFNELSPNINQSYSFKKELINSLKKRNKDLEDSLNPGKSNIYSNIYTSIPKIATIIHQNVTSNYASNHRNHSDSVNSFTRHQPNMFIYPTNSRIFEKQNGTNDDMNSSRRIRRNDIILSSYLGINFNKHSQKNYIPKIDNIENDKIIEKLSGHNFEYESNVYETANKNKKGFLIKRHMKRPEIFKTFGNNFSQTGQNGLAKKDNNDAQAFINSKINYDDFSYDDIQTSDPTKLTEQNNPNIVNDLNQDKINEYGGHISPINFLLKKQIEKIGFDSNILKNENRENVYLYSMAIMIWKLLRNHKEGKYFYLDQAISLSKFTTNRKHK